jgi:hypothetical protein
MALLPLLSRPFLAKQRSQIMNGFDDLCLDVGGLRESFILLDSFQVSVPVSKVGNNNRAQILFPLSSVP